jgi:hypothetical protein
MDVERLKAVVLFLSQAHRVWNASESNLNPETRLYLTLLRQMNKQCTFDELPPERKKPKASSSPSSNVASISSHLAVASPSPGKVKRPRSPDDGSAALQALSYAAAQEKRLRIGESEPMSLDLSISKSLDPHVITTLLTGTYSAYTPVA